MNFRNINIHFRDALFETTVTCKPNAIFAA